MTTMVGRETLMSKMSKYTFFLVACCLFLSACKGGGVSNPLGTPKDVTYIDGLQVGVFDNVRWGEFMRCRQCQRNTPQTNEHDKNGNLYHKCTVCGSRNDVP